VRRFVVRRLMRTVPAYLVVVGLYFSSAWIRADAPIPPLWRFLTFTQNIGLQPGTAFSHAWSLCIEEQFYLVFPLAAALIRPTTARWALLGGVVVGGALLRAWLWSTLGPAMAAWEGSIVKFAALMAAGLFAGWVRSAED
jgi:peptidoglycan/LPS O-acetylase OafA/YrhL